MMNLKALVVFLVAVFFAGNAWADKPKVLQLKDLQPGTHAVGFSVFKGVEPEPFDVVLGETIDQMGDSYILARISGGPMDTPLENIGAISGMSGSPIFVGCINKNLSSEEQLDYCISQSVLPGNDVYLVGALSYSIGSFLQGGVNCLLTPAEYMLGAQAGGYMAASGFYTSKPMEITVNGQTFHSLLILPGMENLPLTGNSGNRAQAEQSSYDGNRCKESVKGDVKAGSMVSVYVATGDYYLGASGTVTWRDGNDIYIFGHPFNGTGTVRYPFVHVSVADTLQTPTKALKLSGCSLDTKGAIFVDGAFEVAGVIGETAPMLSYQVELHMGDGSAVLNEEIALSPMTELIIKKLPGVWAGKMLGDLSRFSVAYQLRMALANQPEIFAKNMIPAQIARDPFDEVFATVYSPIEKMGAAGFSFGVESIKIHLDIVKDFQLWTVQEGFLSQKKANPGETVYVNVVLRESFSSATKQISIPVKVPEDFMERRNSSGIDPYQITVLVQSGNKFTDKGSVAETVSADEFIRQLNLAMNYKTNVMYIQQIMPKSKEKVEAEIANAKGSVKPAWQWTDVGEGDLRQLPSNEQDEVVLTLSPVLNHFIDLDLSFNLRVEEKRVPVVETREEPRRRRWFLFYLF